MSSKPEQTLIDLLGERLGGPPIQAETVDWQRLIELARHNRVAPLVQATLAGRPDVPEAARRELLALGQRSFVETRLTAQALAAVAPALAGLDWVLLRGPALGAGLYGDVMLRPYGDLDLLVAPADVERALAALQSTGFRFPAQALSKEYYRAYHLHLKLTRPGLAGPQAVELHWAIDHPFTLLTVDVAGILRRRTDVLIEGLSIPAPGADDLLLTLALHTVKHSVRLAYWNEIDQAAQIALEGGLLQLFDIAVALQRLKGELHWAELPARAAEWGAGPAAQTCLAAIERLWPGLATVEIRAGFERPRLRGWQRWTYGKLEAGPASDRSGAFDLKPGLFFRPIRLLDTLEYVFAPDEFLRRRYGSSGLGRRLLHTLSATGRLLAGSLALAYYSLAHGISRLPIRANHGSA